MSDRAAAAFLGFGRGGGSTRAWKRSLALAFALCLGPSAGAQEDGWSSLFANRLEEARQRFRASQDVDGLGWIASLEGNREGLLQTWGELIRQHPEDPLALAAWPEVAAAADELGRRDWLSGLAQAVLAHPGAGEPLQDCARAALAAVATNGQAASLDTLTDWKVLGPFDNVSGSGLTKSFPVERGETPATFAGKDRLLLHWQSLPWADPLRHADLARLSRDTEEVYYAATAVQAASPGEARLLFEPTGAGKVWWNGQEVLSHATYGESQGWALPYRARVQLQAGWNTVVVKLATDAEQTTPDFALAVRRADGLPLTVSSAQAALDRPLVGSAPEAQPEGLSALEARAGADVPLWRAKRYGAQGDTQKAVELLQGFARQHPDSGLVLWQLAQRLEEDHQSDDSRQARAKALALLPQLYEPTLETVVENPGSETVATLAEMARRHPGDSSVQLLLYRQQKEAGLKDDARQTLLRLAAMELGPQRLVSVIQLLMAEQQFAQAQRLLQDGLTRFPSSVTLGSMRMSELAQRGDTLEAIAQGERLVHAQPLASVYEYLADLYQQAGQPQKALECLRQARLQRPQDGKLCARVAAQAQALGLSDEAAALYSEALVLEPGQVALRDKLRAARGQKSVLEEVAPALPFDVAKATTTRRNDSVVVLLDEGRTVVYPDHASLTIYRLVAKVNDEQGVQQMAHQNAPAVSHYTLTTLEVARVHKSDGRIVDVRDKATETTVNFPSLQPGDVVETQWRAETAPRGGLADHFWTWWTFDMRATPIELTRFVLACPQDMAIQRKDQGHVPLPREERRGDWTVREWTVTNSPSLVNFDLAVPDRDRSRRTYLSTVPNWKTIVDWYLDLSGPLCKADPMVAAKALELTRGLTREEDKIAAIQRYVAESLRYQTTPFRNSAFVPTSGKKVLVEAYGDCKDKAALICAMLDTVGIKAHIALISTRSNGVNPPLPSPFFNHAIVKVDSHSGPLWIDGTVVQSDLHSLPSEDQEAPVLVIEPDNKELATTPLAPLANNRLVRVERARLGADGSLLGSYRMEGRGIQADALRDGFGHLAPSDWDKVAASTVRELLGRPARVSDTRVENVDDPSQPLRFSMQFACKRYAKHIESSLLLANLFGEGSEDSLELLKTAVTLPNQSLELLPLRGEEMRELDIQLPAGYRLTTPFRKQRVTSLGSYTFQVDQQGDHLHGRLDVVLRASRVSAAQVGELRALVNDLEELTDQPVMLRKGPAR